jgi:hypothetical protein
MVLLSGVAAKVGVFAPSSCRARGFDAAWAVPLPPPITGDTTGESPIDGKGEREMPLASERVGNPPKLPPAGDEVAVGACKAAPGPRATAAPPDCSCGGESIALLTGEADIASTFPSDELVAGFGGVAGADIVSPPPLPAVLW